LGVDFALHEKHTRVGFAFYDLHGYVLTWVVVVNEFSCRWRAKASENLLFAEMLRGDLVLNSRELG
jgi:hypothetical protein